MRKIVVAVDGSLIATKALHFAISMAKAYGDEIRLINIQQSLAILGEATIKEASEIIEKENVPYTSTIRIGTPAVEILNEANNEDVRCLVMGIKGANNTSNKLGSVSQAIISFAPCPVTLIP